MERDLLYATERILPLVINQAMEGDTKAQKLILDRTIPPLKAVSPSLPAGLPTNDIASMLKALLLTIARGEVSPSIGLDVLNLVKQAAELQDGVTATDRAANAAIVEAKRRIADLESELATPGALLMSER